jgi:hypothetical protein
MAFSARFSSRNCATIVQQRVGISDEGPPLILPDRTGPL